MRMAFSSAFNALPIRSAIAFFFIRLVMESITTPSDTLAIDRGPRLQKCNRSGHAA